MRDALSLWDGAETAASLEAFDRAVQLDPACASVHVHAAIAAWTDPEIPTNRVLASLRAARLGVDGLSARERFLLSGFDRLVTDSAPDGAATSAHLLAIAAPFPKDMELLLASRLRTAALGDRPEGLFSSLDPTSAFALWEDYIDDDTAGRFAVAEARLARCVSLPGRPLSCVKAIARNRCVQGRHAEALALAQETLQRKGDIYTASLFMGALAMQGSEKSTVLAAQKRATALADANYKAIVDVRDRAEIAIFFGDFDEAESLLQKADEVARDSPALELHLLAVMPRIGLLQERSRVQEAASHAAAILRDKGAWDEGSDPLTWQAGNWTHEPRLVRLLVEAGKLGALEAEQRIAKWQRARKEDLTPITLWGWTWSMEGLSAERAAEALRTAPPTGDAMDPTLPGQVDRFIGRALALAGRRAEAIPYLRLSANDCAVFDDVVARTVANLWLGEALEAEGDKAGACAAYNVVLRRWGHTKDSRSAGTARAHARALSCPSVAP